MKEDPYQVMMLMFILFSFCYGGMLLVDHYGPVMGCIMLGDVFNG